MLQKIFALFLLYDWIAWGNKSLDSDERVEGVNLAKRTALRIVTAIGSSLGIGAFVMYAALVLGSQVTGETPPLVVTNDTAIIVPQQPGPDYNTLAWCENPAVVKDADYLRRDDDKRIVLVLPGTTERVNWSGSEASSAFFKWRLPDGTEREEPVPMSKDAQKCFREKAR